MTSSILYRLAQRSDIPHMARIWGLEKGEGGTSEERMTAYFDGQLHPQQALPPRVIFVACEGDALIGYIAGHLTRRHGCDGELEWLYVAPESRNQGVALGLLRRLVTWFEEQHASRVCVNVAPWNVVAIRFYVRHGAEGMNQHWLVWNDVASALDRTRGLGDVVNPSDSAPRRGQH
jgi:GNAT superfamily N-acetyltransferase